MDQNELAASLNRMDEMRTEKLQDVEEQARSVRDSRL